MNETQRFLFVFFMLSACATAAVLTLRVLRLRHKVFWTYSLVIMSSGGILWLLSNAARLLTDSLEVWKFSTITGGMGISMATFGLMTFSVQISTRVRKIPRQLLWVFLPLLVIYSALAWTNDLHHLVWTTWPVPGQDSGQPGLVKILFLCVIYSQIAVALSALVRSCLKKDSIFRVQTGLLLAGVILPVAAGLAEDLLNLTFLPGVDAAALATMGTIGIFALVTLRYGTFSVIPVAYKMMVDAMQEGMIVLDLENHVLSYNPAAVKFLGNPQPTRTGMPGMPFDVVLAGWSSEAQAAWTAGKDDFDVVLSGETSRNYRLVVQDLIENNAESAGKMVIIYDTTRQKQLESSLHEMAINDPLTGCFNRTHFMECAGKQFRQALRYHRPLSVAMIDLDHFKQVNDDFGHATGDRVLKRVVAACMASLRRSDIFARYGGEEFLVMMPETGASDALLVAERLREAISGQFLQGAMVTASIGVAWLDPEEEIDLERLLDRADQAQYRSKGLGRDRVTLWKK